MAIRALFLDLGKTLFTQEDASIYDPLYESLSLDRQRQKELYRDLLVKSFGSFPEIIQHAENKFLRKAGKGVAQAMSARYEDQKRTGRLFPDAEPALTALKERQYLLCVVSNITSPSTWILERRTRVGTSLMNLFDAVCYSCNAGVRKPDQAIYDLALKKLNKVATQHGQPELQAHQALMIGDNYEYDVAAPRRYGLRAKLLDREGTLTDKSGRPKLKSLTALVWELQANSARTPSPL
ncbi:HAD family hydrolase [Candidatus Woesearchaeota archaeon]|nr:HAD family hydrolase [Candidatus Woesearchaeota archaeon]